MEYTSTRVSPKIAAQVMGISKQLMYGMLRNGEIGKRIAKGRKRATHIIYANEVMEFAHLKEWPEGVPYK